MQINWFTVIAQVINFIILVGLLKRFLYKPILTAIDDRDKKIASQLEEAKALEIKAETEKNEYKQKNELFDKEKKTRMDNAVSEINEERQKLLTEARNDADDLRSKLENSIQELHEKINQQIVQKTKEEVYGIVRKALNDLASVTLEEQLVKVFIKRITQLKGEEKKKLLTAFHSNTDNIVVKSAFELSKKQQDEIINFVSKVIETEAGFQFKTVPKLIGGIEINANGYNLAWSISEYINALENSISEIIEGISHEGKELKNKPKSEKNKDMKKEPVSEKK